jgi:hypothetical protein
MNPAEVVEKLDDLDAEALGKRFRETIKWVDGALYAEIFRDRERLLQMMESGLRSARKIRSSGRDDAARLAHGRWRDVIELGMAAEPAMIIGGRQGAWDRLLRLVEAAAREDLDLSRSTVGDSTAQEGDVDSDIDDHDDDDPGDDDIDDIADDDDIDDIAWASEPLAWALHQRGSRALLRDELNEARTVLNASLEHRRSKKGKDLTRGNLILLPLGVLPFALLLFLPLFLVGVAATQVNRFDERAATADITPDSMRFEGEGYGEPFKVRNIGATAVWVREIEIVPDEGTAFPDPNGLVTAQEKPCKKNKQIPAGDFCTVTVWSNGMESIARLRVSVHTRAGTSRGDQWAVLISTPEPDGS